MRFESFRKNLLLVVVVFGSILLTAGETRGQCTCVAKYVNITPREEFNLAYAVFVGKVVTIKKTPRDKNNHYTETVTFQVSKTWKRDVNSKLTISNTIQGCLNGFEENEEWLVYAYKDQDETLGTLCCCSRTTLLIRAGKDLKEFAREPPAKILGPPNSEP